MTTTTTRSTEKRNEVFASVRYWVAPTADHSPFDDFISLQSSAHSLLECPNELPPVAREEWKRIVGELAALSILSKFDRVPLAIYCGAYALWIEAFEAIQKYTTTLRAGRRELWLGPSRWLNVRDPANIRRSFDGE